MPTITKDYYHNIDLLANQLLNSRLHNITTAARIILGNSLTSQSKGYQVYDTDLSAAFYWNGSAWNSASAIWGSITGTLSNQTDLQNALNAKFDDPTGTTSQYIRGDGSLATFPTVPSVTPASLTATSDTNVTITLGGTPATALLQGVSLTLGWTGKLADNRIDSASTWNAKQAALSGTGIVKSTSGTISYITDNSSNWNTAYTNRITSLTTTGSSGAATLSSNILNVPNYTLSGLGGEPAITAGTTSQYWRGDKTWQTFPTIPTVGTWGALNYPNWTTGTPFVKMTAVGTFALDTNTYLTSITSSDVTTALGYTPVTNARNLTINGTTYDLTADRTWSVGTVTSVSATAPITSSGGTTPTISTSMATNKLIGRSTAGTGVMEEITVGTGLSLSGGTLSATATGILHGTATGTDTYAVTITGPTSYADGDAYLIRFTNGNTSGATLNINGLGARTLYRNNDGPLLGGDIEDGGEMLCVYNSTLVGFQCIGTSPNTLLAYVTNDDSVAITKGQAVYAFGGTGDRMTVKRAVNTGDSTSAQTVGLVWSTSIAPNQKGFIMTQGLLDGLSILPTSTYNDGDAVYLGSTPGAITKVKPYAPNHLVYLGVVTTANNGSAGRMYVKVQNGYELDELHNVQAQSPSVNDVLYYFGGSPGQWKTASISTILGYTPLQRSVNVVSTNTAAGSAVSTDYVYLVSGTTTITLPTPVGNTNQYTIKRVGTNTVSIATTSGTIDGSASPITINVQYVSLTLVSDGTNWNII
jgi:hypothetical protein